MAGLLSTELRDPIDENAEKVHRALIHPETVIGVPTLPFATATPAEELQVLDRQQEALARGLGDGHRVIRGVAGSGKTLVLTFRARHLAALHPGQRVLVTCYNRALAGSLARQLSDLPYLYVAVKTIDQVIKDLLFRCTGRGPDFTSQPELAEGSTSLLVVADAAQNIYRNPDFTWKAAGINVAGRTHVLTIGYRNTREVLEFAHNFLMRGGDVRLDAGG